MKKLRELLAPFQECLLKGDAESLVSGVCADSRQVSKGDLFIARKGAVHSGQHFVKDAVKAGAGAILTEEFLPEFHRVPQILHPHLSQVEALIAAHYYDYPARELIMMGVTGTNGKTTTSWMIHHLLEQLVGVTGWIGTIEYRTGIKTYEAVRTTPGAVDLQRLLREMKSAGCRTAVMEVTSHALDQGRVEGIHFHSATFTNLTLDHLDYHLTMEAYCLAKNRLFRTLDSSSLAIINQDSPWKEPILKGCSAQMFTYGVDHPADLQATHVRGEEGGMRFDLVFQGRLFPCQIPYFGLFNVYNSLAALSSLLTRGFSLEELLPCIKRLSPLRGRLEPVENSLGIKIYVDFAHTGDGLKQVLKTLHEIKKGRLIALFGCGGDRDRKRRSQMAEAAEAYADVIWITSDNPRSEEPMAICQEIAASLKQPGSAFIEPDRRAAIQLAIEMAQPHDTLLIAGKGHETYQIIGNQTLAFDDVAVATEICNSADIH